MLPLSCHFFETTFAYFFELSSLSFTLTPPAHAFALFNSLYLFHHTLGGIFDGDDVFVLLLALERLIVYKIR